MGYTTDFTGQFNLYRQLEEHHLAYLIAFSETRRMKRDPSKLSSDPLRSRVNLQAGIDGEYHVAGESVRNDVRNDRSVVDVNKPPVTQPGLWCQWRPNQTGTAIEWDGTEKFYNYVEWIKYLIDHFLAPWGYRLNGVVEWQGEESDDVGTITIVDNTVSIRGLPLRGGVMVKTLKPRVLGLVTYRDAQRIVDMQLERRVRELREVMAKSRANSRAVALARERVAELQGVKVILWSVSRQ
jgi:hypothetical protein